MPEENEKSDIPSNTVRGDLAIFKKIKELYERTSTKNVPNELSFDINTLKAIAGEGNHYWQKDLAVYSSVDEKVYSLVEMPSDGKYRIANDGMQAVAEVEKVEGGYRVYGELVDYAGFLNSKKIYASLKEIFQELADYHERAEKNKEKPA